MPDSPEPGTPAGPAEVAAGQPALRIVAGQPTPEETAAVVVVFSALASQLPPGLPAPARSQWAARSRLLREPVSPGPGGWRASALPR
ncbi:MAG TPA: acyl-CoA carboxylase subunit epsilon [Streptosporangiaceae bacterium]|nr:acyl-CoA carboxylase subunit epsilon [Streptosporangiaceae bacterium]